MKHRLVGLAAAFTMAVIGCVPSTPGELGAGSFTYECEQDGYDPACADSVLNQQEVPEKVAVGAAFEITFKSLVADEPGSVVISSASNEIITRTGAGFVFKKAGFGALLAQEASGTIVDFKHLQSSDVDHLDVRANGQAAARSVDLAVGDSLSFTVEPVDDGGAILSGALEYSWAVSTGDIDLQVSGVSTNKATVVANAAGVAQVTVAAAGKVAVIDLVVGGQP